MRLDRLFPVLLAAFLAPAALASVDRGVLLSNEIRTQQHEIRQGVEARQAPYDSLSPSQRVELLSKQSRMLRLLDGKQSTDDLNEQQKLEVFNTLEWIEAAINKAGDERLICRREKTIGSTRVTRVCRTAADEARMKEEARRRMLEGSIDGSR